MKSYENLQVSFLYFDDFMEKIIKARCYWFLFFTSGWNVPSRVSLLRKLDTQTVTQFALEDRL